MPGSSRSDDEYAREVYGLLEHALRDELAVHEAIVTLGLTEEAIEELAAFLADRLDRAFHFAWAPSWVRPGEPHIWSEAGMNHLRCSECLQVETGLWLPELRRWHLEHRSTAHGMSD